MGLNPANYLILFGLLFGPLAAFAGKGESSVGVDLRLGTSVQRLERQVTGPQTLAAITNSGSDGELWFSYRSSGSFRAYLMGGSRSYNFDLLSTQTLDNSSVGLTKAALAISFEAERTEILFGAWMDDYPYTEDVSTSLVTIKKVSAVTPYFALRFRSDKTRGGPRLVLEPYANFFGTGGLKPSSRGPVLSLGSYGKVVWGSRWMLGLIGGIGITEFQYNNNLYYSSSYSIGITLGNSL